MKKIIKVYDYTGDFAENKDLARELRIDYILPNLERKERVIIDFAKVKSTTQSFIHALISDVIRKRGAGALNNVYFRNCNEVIKKIIEIVTEYMQDSF